MSEMLYGSSNVAEFKQLQAFLNRRAFHVNARWTFGWLLMARDLMRAAEKLWAIVESAQTREMGRFMAEAQQSFGQPPRSRSRNLEGQEPLAIPDARRLRI